MFRNYLLTAWRHIMKNRLFSAINVFGLAIGMMSCILILLFVRDELTYDQWVPEADKVVRIHSAFYPQERPPFLTVRSAGRIMGALKAYASAEVAEGVRLVNNTTTIIKDNNAFTEQVTFADGTFFDVLDLPFVHGDASSSFSRPLDMLLTEELAIKYFGRTDVVGETLTACCLRGQPMTLPIAGVLKDIPGNSHLQLGFLVRMEPSMFDFAPNILNTWTSVNVYTYFKLKDGATAADLQARYDTWLDNESPFSERTDMPGKVTDFVKPNVMPLLDLHLHARRDAGNMGDLSPMGDINMVYTFSGVALLILLIASINFMNLSTAKASKRAREVALRKVMGATRRQVALQFLGEAVAIAALGLLFAFVGVELALPLYNDAIDKDLVFDVLQDLPLLLSLAGVAIVVGLLSGSYPAAFLSRFLPARILKANKSSDVGGASTFRSALVVFQFAISIGLVMCTAVIYGQTTYAKSMDVGYVHSGKLAITNLGNAAGTPQAETIRQALEQLPGVSKAVLSSEVPSQDNENNTGFTVLDNTGADMQGDQVVVNYHSVGYDFFEAYGISPIAGRTFDEAFGTDAINPIPDGEDRIGTASVVLNEAAVRSLGFASPAQALGKTLRAEVFQSGRHDFTIVGVVPDIYFRSLKFGVRSTAYWINPPALDSITLTLNTDNIQSVTTGIAGIWRDHLPMTPLGHQFVSDMLAAQYASEEAQAKLFAAFSGLAIIVACLGLYGLAAFSAEQRTKEIGIRKVLGARVVDIVKLLVWQFSRPVLIANVIAWPVGWYVMSGWLESFQYRLDSTFVIAMALAAGMVALLIAWLTVAGRAAHVAQANPIQALRYE
ncbi:MULTISPECIES: ABC transporter permease [Kordiimonas]|jgi:putative ABC transport system permease protein|uniref:ABC transporter permease n=1 Tax=Kordiimonas TaxID=288021 RepID=UPI00257ED514|nr:ABC transporter permease [Kordiimonas sp. UBA4487]